MTYLDRMPAITMVTGYVVHRRVGPSILTIDGFDDRDAANAFALRRERATGAVYWIGVKVKEVS